MLVRHFCPRAIVGMRLRQRMNRQSEHSHSSSRIMNSPFPPAKLELGWYNVMGKEKINLIFAMYLPFIDTRFLLDIVLFNISLIYELIFSKLFDTLITYAESIYRQVLSQCMKFHITFSIIFVMILSLARNIKYYVINGIHIKYKISIQNFQSF